ncbi:NAD(P)/FAD-dependent oxidoreductase [Marimonas lutisalis]|uniref:NAD(P)/FAD-dependent oxidoreductase n=1 Tax=Marimonas lutisalis TaxID=2545756 RepID=UPI0010F491DA|nr:FAD-binding oxidoreductase [Marimonas lutisalis]
MTRQDYEIAVIGGGIAGASVAAELAAHPGLQGSVALLEMEAQPGYHTTGRSAAVFAPIYGPAPIRALTRASEGFFRAPPAGFCESSLFSPRLIMMIARPDQRAALDALLAEVGDAASVSEIDEPALRAANPLVRAGYATAAMLDTNGQDIDVAGLHQGYLRMFKAAGGEMHLRSPVTGLAHDGALWRIETPGGEFTARRIVNTAGAWANELGDMAGAEPIGLTPKRRTALMVAAPDGVQPDAYPITIDIEEDFYLKPDAGRLLISPADETPSPPCDAQPEELDIAICVDRIETAFDLSVRRIENKWAGLRSFVADKCPVVGYSATAPGFFWLAGQGGYGIQSAPALSRFAASQVLDLPAPDDILAEGLDPASLLPARLLQKA